MIGYAANSSSSKLSRSLRQPSWYAVMLHQVVTTPAAVFIVAWFGYKKLEAKITAMDHTLSLAWNTSTGRQHQKQWLWLLRSHPNPPPYISKQWCRIVQYDTMPDFGMSIADLSPRSLQCHTVQDANVIGNGSRFSSMTTRALEHK
jgi:hypothetical protein